MNEESLPVPQSDEALPIPVKLLTPAARVPQRAYEHDAAFDLFAAEAVVIPPLGRAVVGTGIALGLPPGLAALTLPRSGLAARHGISIVNAPGLIDPGYRGEVRVILLNTDAHEPFTVAVGDRIAQLLLVALPPVDACRSGYARRHAPRRAGLRLQRPRRGSPTTGEERASHERRRRRERAPTIRVGGLFEVDGKILMVQQGRGDDRYWLLPGGGVRFGESLAQALIRETQEELGLRVAVGAAAGDRRVDLARTRLPEARRASHLRRSRRRRTPTWRRRTSAVLGARFLSETRSPRPTCGRRSPSSSTACLRERPSSPQYLGRRW